MLNKKWLLSSLILLNFGCIVQANAQQVFSKTYDYRHQAEGFNQAFLDFSDSSYLISANAGSEKATNDSTRFTTCFQFLKISKTGILDSLPLPTYYRPYLSSWALNVKNYDKDTNLLYFQMSFLGTLPSGKQVFENYIYCTNIKGDSLWAKKLIVNNDSNVIKSVFKLNGNYYTVGNPAFVWGRYIFLAKHDSTGKLLFYQEFDEGLGAYQIALIGVNRILTVGQHAYRNQDEILDHQPWYMITDTTGKVLFQKKYTSPLRDDNTMYGIHKINENCFLIDGSKRFNLGDNALFYLTDTLGNISRKWDMPLDYGANDVTVLPDKKIVFVGNNPLDELTVGKMIKMDTLGNLIWSRQYYTSYYDQSCFFSITQGFNKGFVLTGSAYDTLLSHNRQNGWLVVTDSFGCVTPGCQLTNYVQEITKDKLDYISCWPNPVSDLLSCKIHPSLSVTECTILVIDENGKELIKINPNANNIEVNVEKLAAGFYYVMLLKNNRLLTGRKIIKQ